MDTRFENEQITNLEEKFKIASVLKRSNTAYEITKVLTNRGQCTVTKLIQITRIDQPTISQVLSKMRKIGYAKRKQRGKFAVYSLTGITFKDILKEYAQMIEA